MLSMAFATLSVPRPHQEDAVGASGGWAARFCGQPVEWAAQGGYAASGWAGLVSGKLTGTA